MPGARDLRVRDFVIPAGELRWSFDPSGGPGGQHANRSSTRVTLLFDLVRSSAFPESTRRQLLERLGRRARAGVVTIVCDDTRSQWRNRNLGRQRLIDLLEGALVPEQTRRETKPSRSVRRRRLQEKRRRGETKRLRGRPAEND